VAPSMASSWLSFEMARDFLVSLKPDTNLWERDTRKFHANFQETVQAARKAVASEFLLQRKKCLVW
jgi:hypothetical protein